MSSPVTLRDLQAEPLGVATPFDLRLDGETLTVHQVLRHIPGRRLAGRASWRGRPVFAKLFFGATEAARREAACQETLAAAGVATPALVYQAESVGGSVLLNEWSQGIDGEQAVQQHGHAALNAILDAVFALHGAGLQQKDLHLGNFLFQNGRVQVIDAGQIVRLPTFRRTAARLENLALLCAQAPLNDWREVQQTVAVYMVRHGLPVSGFGRHVQRLSQRRITRAMKKWHRASSAIGMVEDEHGQWLYDRTLSQSLHDELRSCLLAPDHLPVLKPSSRVTVYADARWIVKQYRDVGWKVRLRHCFTRTRGDISWRAGWTWDMLGVPTPRPVMLRRLKNGESAIAFPRILGEPLSDLMRDQRERATLVAPVVEQWLCGLHEVGFVHGDVKAQNILVQADDQPWFIDLDGAAMIRLPAWRRHRSRREMQRFARNWAQFAAAGETQARRMDE